MYVFEYVSGVKDRPHTGQSLFLAAAEEASRPTLPAKSALPTRSKGCDMLLHWKLADTSGAHFCGGGHRK